jgi:hypothetical protein
MAPPSLIGGPDARVGRVFRPSDRWDDVAVLLAHMPNERRIATIGAGVSLVVSAALVIRLVAIGNEPVIVILIPAVIAAILALASARAGVQLAAAILTSLTAMVSLFGGVGLLFVPSIVMFVWSASQGTSPEREPGR